MGGGGGGYIPGGSGRFWECRKILYLLQSGVYSCRDGLILGALHIVVEKGGYILGGRDRFWEGRTYEFVEKGIYSGREGLILEGSHNIIVVERGGGGVYSGREG